MDVETFLVILLSVGFIMMLALTVTLLVVLIRIFSSVRRMTERAELATANFSATLRSLTKRLAPGILTGAAGAALRKMRQRSKQSD